MLYLIDHNDSFTYNLAAQIRKYCDVHVLSVSEIGSIAWDELEVDGIILSPGPKAPSDYPQTRRLFERFYQQVPIIGICLGHQMIGEYLGATIIEGKKPIQGYVHTVMVKAKEAIFKGLQEPLKMTRYHSLHVVNLPAELCAIGWSEDRVVQIMRHYTLPLYSVQFHPESCGSENGNQLMHNILKEVGLCN